MPQIFKRLTLVIWLPRGKNYKSYRTTKTECKVFFDFYAGSQTQRKSGEKQPATIKTVKEGIQDHVDIFFNISFAFHYIFDSEA